MSLDACLNAPQLWIEAEVQQKSQISGIGDIAVQDFSQWWFESPMQDAQWLRVFLWQPQS